MYADRTGPSHRPTTRLPSAHFWRISGSYAFPSTSRWAPSPGCARTNALTAWIPSMRCLSSAVGNASSR
eukprot:7391805-Prymnesium_polylepis.1